MRENKTIVNIGSETWTIHKTYGFFVIPGQKPPFPYNFARIQGRTEPLDLGDGRYQHFPISAEEICRDLVQDLENHGVFVAAGEKPTQLELSQARERMENYYRHLVEDGDGKYAANRDMSRNGITDVHRRAALYLGEEREWAYVARRKVDCPFCSEKVVPGVAICRSCNSILDPDKALAGGLISAQQHKTIVMERRKLKFNTHRGEKAQTTVAEPKKKLEGAKPAIPGAAGGVDHEAYREQDETGESEPVEV